MNVSAMIIYLLSITMVHFLYRKSGIFCNCIVCLINKQWLLSPIHPWKIKTCTDYVINNYICTVYKMQRGKLLFSLGEIGRKIPNMILLFRQLGQIVWKMQDIGYFSTKKLLNLFFQKKKWIPNLRECFNN